MRRHPEKLDPAILFAKGNLSSTESVLDVLFQLAPIGVLRVLEDRPAVFRSES